MKRKSLRFGRGFRVALGNARAEAAEMVIKPGDAEGDASNRHRGADQWLFVVAGEGVATINGRRYPLRERTFNPPRLSFTFSVWQLPSGVSGGTYPRM